MVLQALYLKPVQTGFPKDSDARLAVSFVVAKEDARIYRTRSDIIYTLREKEAAYCLIMYCS